MKAGGTLLCQSRLALLSDLLIECLRLDGEVWECGVYAGGSALHILDTLCKYSDSRKFRLFDSFSGIKTAGQFDTHRNGDFGDADAESVKGLFSGFDQVVIHEGVIPDVFSSLGPSQIVFAHVDVDVFESTSECLKEIWPRLADGGIVVVDDYFADTCLGARKAVDEFLSIENNASSSRGVHPQLIIEKLNLRF